MKKNRLWAACQSWKPTEIVYENFGSGGYRSTLQKLKYLDQVVSETLRKWSTSLQLDRICVNDYIYDDGWLKLKIGKGLNIIFPIFGLNRDPTYCFNPDKFLKGHINSIEDEKSLSGSDQEG